MPDHFEVGKRAIAAFLAQDYGACVGLVAPLLPSTTVVNLQLLLISLQRLDRWDDVAAFAAEYVVEPPRFPWEQALFRLSLGTADPAEVLAAASTGEERAEAFWYAAERRLTLGDLAGAAAAYRDAAGTEVDCVERTLAAFQLERLADPASGFPAPEAQLRALRRAGVALLHLGRNAEAVRALDEALVLLRNSAGDQGPEYAEVLRQLAEAHAHLGNLEHAQALLAECAAILRAADPSLRRELASVLNSLAAVRAELGAPRSAIALLEEAVVASDQDPLMVYNLAEVKFRLRDLDTAEQLLAGIPPAGPAMNRTDMLVAALRSAIRLQRGEPERAVELASAAFAAARTGLGQKLEINQIAMRLLTAALLTDRLDQAADALTTMIEVQRAMVHEPPATGTARGRDRVAKYAQQLAELVLSVVGDRMATFPRAGAVLGEVLLSSKNLAARLAAHRYAATGPETAGIAAEMDAVDAEIARLAMDGPGRADEKFERHRGRLDELQDRKDELEMRLARSRQDVPPTMTPAVAEIAAAIPDGHVLVEFARYRQTEVRAEGPVRRSAQRYLAVVLPAGAESPVAVPLGPAEAIDAAIKAYRDGVDEGSPAKLLDEIGRQVRRLVFDPVRPHLGTAGRLVVAPDGEIGSIPLEVLAAGDGHLIDDFWFSYIGCAAELVEPVAPVAPAGVPPGPSVVVAAPDYDLSTGDAPTGRFPYLTGARDEGRRVAELLGVPVLSGPEATKRRVRDADRPQVLHIATHGFYLPSLAYDFFELTGDLMYIAAEDLTGGRLTGHRILDPFLRCGLVLAGANDWLGFRQPPPEAENGLLTAADVVRMRLHGTELVVLSACETGLGQAKNLEGMTGLRQAFRTAGARALISSIWQVPDQRTPALFAAFYDRLLGGATTAEALRAAQLEIRRRHRHPRFWGSFVHYGAEPVRLTPDR